MKVQLIVVQGKPEGKVIPLTGPTFRIGRAPECHLKPNSDEISRNHAEFTISDSGVVLRDMGSRNGTVVNGKSLTEPIALKNGDLIQIAKLTFAVIIQGLPGEATVKPAAPGASPAVAASAQQAAASLDDVSHAEIESWLVTDPTGQTPERASGVYGGDTITIGAYKSGEAAKVAASDPAAVAAAPASAKPAAVAAPPVAAPAVPAAPVAAPVAAPIAAAAKPSPAPVAKPAAAAAVQTQSLYQDAVDSAVDNMEHLPEGVGDGDEGEGGEDGENEDEESVDDVPQDMMDENNPFFVAKKKAQEEQVAKKPAYVDSSDAASDILKKMLDQRRAARSS
jgi:pSer/pThr/pTyr-binding forkhead associated (FHA) protein